MKPSVESNRLFVGNLSNTTTEDDLQRRFSKFGEVSNIELKNKKDFEGNIISTFAFLNLVSSSDKLQGCLNALNNADVNGSYIRVQVAKEKFLNRLQAEREQNEKKRNFDSRPDNQRGKNYDPLALFRSATQKGKQETFEENVNDEQEKMGNLPKFAGTKSKKINKPDKDEDSEITSENIMSKMEKYSQMWSDGDSRPVAVVKPMFGARKHSYNESSDNHSFEPENKRAKRSQYNSNEERNTETVEDQEPITDSFKKKNTLHDQKKKDKEESKEKRKKSKVKEVCFDDEVNNEIDPDNEKETSLLNVNDEKERQLAILSSVIPSTSSNEIDQKIPEKMLVRYDPLAKEHVKFEKKESKNKAETENNEETDVPEVSSERYYITNTDLKSVFNQSESTGFSLRNLFQPQDEEQNEEYAQPKIERKAFKKEETPKKKEKLQNEPYQNQSNYWKNIGANHESFFIHPNDKRLSDGVDFLRQEGIHEMEENRQKWSEHRFHLIKFYKNKMRKLSSTTKMKYRSTSFLEDSYISPFPEKSGRKNSRNFKQRSKTLRNK